MDADLETLGSNCKTNIINTINNDENNITGSQKEHHIV